MEINIDKFEKIGLYVSFYHILLNSLLKAGGNLLYLINFQHQGEISLKLAELTQLTDIYILNPSILISLYLTVKYHYKSLSHETDDIKMLIINPNESIKDAERHYYDQKLYLLLGINLVSFIVETLRIYGIFK